MQTVQGLRMEVVDITTWPQPLPITGLTGDEAIYEKALSMARGYVNPSFDPHYPRTGKNAKALTQAIETGIISKAGKYGIHFPNGSQEFVIYEIND